MQGEGGGVGCLRTPIYQIEIEGKFLQSNCMHGRFILTDIKRKSIYLIWFKPNKLRDFSSKLDLLENEKLQVYLEKN